MAKPLNSSTPNAPTVLGEFEDFEDTYYPRPGDSDFSVIVDKAMGRRGFLGGAAALGLSSFVVGGASLVPGVAKAATSRLGFKQVAANSMDTVTVPEGYNWHVVAKWGEPMWSRGPEWDGETRGTGASQELAFGDNCDGMSLFSIGNRSVLAVNNEYCNRSIMYGARESKLPENVDDVRKGKAAHGVSIIEIAETNGRWGIVKDSEYNRKVTADATTEITGPARGHDLLKTAADPSGTTSLGTWNNCGNGRTPWGTYLACEENFNGYFSSSDEAYVPSAELNRYGVGLVDRGYAWAMGDERFDISKHPNESNRCGYITEIDPLDPTSTPKKRTALGRFKHENAAVTIAGNGHVVVYLGDDERGEFMYRFVSEGRYTSGGDNSDLLENGKLYVAKFSDDQTGEWIELNPANTGMASQAEISVHTRIAASAVGATTMDRPEWVAVNPNKPEAYCCLTNNKNRAKKPNAGGDPTPVNGPNPRAENHYGQIVRVAEDGGDQTANTFTWDLFVTAGNPTVHSDAYAGSANVNAENMFNSADGLSFDQRGMLWIQTDGNYTNEGDFAGMGNNQMLVGDTETGEIRRFLVGPRQAEITGIAWSADNRTMFVGVQHPGEKGDSHWPDGGSSVPRSSVIAVRRDDGGPIS